MTTKSKGIILVLLFLISVFSVGFTAITPIKETEKASSVKQTTENVFILKEYNEKIAIFENGDTTPKKILDVYLNDLPQRDITRLKSGIKTNSFSSALSIAEDYE